MSLPEPDCEGAELRFPNDGGCFGCSPSNAGGLRLRFFRKGDEVRGSYSIPDRFHGAPGIAHGGIVASILDEFSCAAAVFLLDVQVVTGELTIRYEAPCPVEEPIEIRAQIVDRSHPRYLVIESEARYGSKRVVRASGKFFRRAADQPAP